jgi:hypothetical protein
MAEGAVIGIVIVVLVICGCGCAVCCYMMTKKKNYASNAQTQVVHDASGAPPNPYQPTGNNYQQAPTHI